MFSVVGRESSDYWGTIEHGLPDSTKHQFLQFVQDRGQRSEVKGLSPHVTSPALQVGHQGVSNTAERWGGRHPDQITKQ